MKAIPISGCLIVLTASLFIAGRVSVAQDLTLTIKVTDNTLLPINRNSCEDNTPIPIDWTTDSELPADNTYQFYVTESSDCQFSQNTSPLLEGTLPASLGGLFDQELGAQDLLDQISQDSCGGEEGIEGELFLCMRILDQSDQEIAKASISLQYDTIVPLSPSSLSAQGGDGNIKLSWENQDKDTISYYRIYWDTTSYDGDISGYSFSQKANSTSYQITGLENDVTYYIVVTTVDDAGNESDPSVEVTAIPMPSLDFWEYYKKKGGQEEGGYCFVYTVSFGSESPFVLPVMRHFRDRILKRFALGRWFVDEYYRNGSSAAKVLLYNPLLRYIFKPLLLLITLFAFMALKPLLLIPVAAISLFFIFRRSP